ncbi:3-dehydroquinate synthase [Lewinella aquimaris]|uniref:3-dehydroquinate synthase n=1 Tax=Neolewinella aquimaris TaxID=1835722 RepID=A0A840DX36_9BACT|nr:3-dehydroquinate synthase [Neolewinella aquimaris]MBB4077500.1 3-dehydroquinate synthase [Neolewinella aquimaris]
MELSVGGEYGIVIDAVGAEQFAWLRERAYAGWVLIMDEETERYCLPRIERYLGSTPLVKIVVPAGERHKHLDTCKFIWEEMFRGGVGRRWCCLNLGGGVIGDMGGFAAGTFKRGIDFVQIPTTLLSQVDASVGGKLGIDFYEVKNSIGLFANPQAVWVDAGFLGTLPEREIRSGYAEIIKHALIADEQQWSELRDIKDIRGLDWPAVIERSVDIKRQVVLKDPFERGIRKALNFGHTIGHAVESYFLHREDRLLHGEAIAIGMITESWLSHETGDLSAAALDDIRDYCLRVYGHQHVPEASFPVLLDLMRQDKKNDTEAINFTFLEKPGEAVVNKTATADMITRSLAYYNSLGS